MGNDAPPLSKAESQKLINEARLLEDDRFANSYRMIPVGQHIVTFIRGKPPLVELDVLGAGPAMREAAATCKAGVYREDAFDRIVARHRAYREAVEAARETASGG